MMPAMMTVMAMVASACAMANEADEPWPMMASYSPRSMRLTKAHRMNAAQSFASMFRGNVSAIAFARRACGAVAPHAPG